MTLPAGFVARISLALLVSGLLVGGSLMWQGVCGFDIADEGFLWYGVQRVQAGELPLRDFMSYDPGRYYWSAALMAVLRDDGILALRGAVAAFQFAGLFAALLLLAQARPRPDAWLWAIAAVTLLAWMYPRHKLFDVSLAIMLVGVLTLVVRQPCPRRFFLAGAAVGLVAGFGRNHGVYGVAGVVGVVVYLLCRGYGIRVLLLNLALCGCGIVAGYLPILVLIAAAPGYAAAFGDTIRIMLGRGTANLPLPVPWPWLVPLTELPPTIAILHGLTGIFFVAIAAFGVLIVLWLYRNALQRAPVAPELVAASVLVLPYAHFAFSRADVSHLAQGIFPFLICIFLLLGSWPRLPRRAAALALAGASLALMLPRHPGWSCRVNSQYVAADIGGDQLEVDMRTAAAVAMLRDTAARYAPEGRSFLVTPVWPGAYALLRRKSPMWESYALFPSTEEFQQREIDRITTAQPGFVLILDVAVDGRDDLRFRNTHPLIERFVRDHFDPVTIAGWSSPLYQFYRSR